MYLKYIYIMLSILQMHLHIYVLYRNTLQLYLTGLLKSAKLERLILCLIHFNWADVVLKWYTEVYLIVLSGTIAKYTSGTL